MCLNQGCRVGWKKFRLRLLNFQKSDSSILKRSDSSILKRSDSDTSPPKTSDSGDSDSRLIYVNLNRKISDSDSSILKRSDSTPHIQKCLTPATPKPWFEAIQQITCSKYFKYFKIFAEKNIFGSGGEGVVKTKIGWKIPMLNHSNKPYVT